ncbi:hypothetical protein ACEF08_00385 [Streptococcus suis]
MLSALIHMKEEETGSTCKGEPLSPLLLLLTNLEGGESDLINYLDILLLISKKIKILKIYQIGKVLLKMTILKLSK